MGGMAGGGGSSGGGGGGGGQKYTPPPKEVNIPTTGYGGMGPTITPQTFTQQGMPNWMQANNAPQQQGYAQGQPNWFGAPWWGMSASNPNQALTQQDLMYQAPPAPAQAQQQAPAQQKKDEGSRFLNYGDGKVWDMYTGNYVQADPNTLAALGQATWASPEPTGLMFGV